MLWTAFMLGIVGSTHCLLMCGPLTLLLPKLPKVNSKVIVAKLGYNLGRIFSYVFLGYIIGVVGAQFLVFSSQRTLSIVMGIFLLVVTLLFFFSNISNKLKSSFGLRASILKSWIKRSLKLSYFMSHFSFGLVNGFLPCGLSFTALAAAFLLLNPLDAALYMFTFGMGTLPMMFIASLGFSTIVQKLKFDYKKLLPFTYAAMAIWLIFRGINTEPRDLYGNNKEKVVNCVP